MNVEKLSVHGENIYFYAETEREKKHIELFRESKKELKESLKYISPGGVYYDIGANVGVYSCVVGVVVQEITVVSVEPHLESRRRLFQNITLNNLNGFVLPCFVAGQGGKTRYLTKNKKPGGMVTETQRNMEAGREVDVFKLDDIKEKFDVPAPTDIKVDVDGGEKEVINGGVETLKGGGIKSLALEIHPHFFEYYYGGSEKINEIKRQIVDFGFEIEHVERDLEDRIKQIYACK